METLGILGVLSDSYGVLHVSFGVMALQVQVQSESILEPVT